MRKTSSVVRSVSAYGALAILGAGACSDGSSLPSVGSMTSAGSGGAGGVANGGSAGAGGGKANGNNAGSSGSASAVVAGTTSVAGGLASSMGGAPSGSATAGAAGSTTTGGTGGSGGGGTAGTGGAPIACAVQPSRIFDDVEYFASDACRGRYPGDQGSELALARAEAAFKAAGLAPAGDQGSYRQAFPFNCSSAFCKKDPSGMAENVLGKLVGTDPQLKDEVIVIGAHIDHLGVDGGQIYRGADDNASGAAVVLELARMFARCGIAPKRTLLFAEWNGEEMGLLGSKYYVAHPTLPLEDTIAAYNFDMVGGGDGSGVLLFGGNDEANRWLTDLMINAAKAAGLPHVIQLVPQKLASDHAPFVQAGIPICWGFSRPDPHPGYHSPDDDISHVKLQSLQAVSELFWAALRPLAMGEEGAFMVSAPAHSVLPPFGQESE